MGESWFTFNVIKHHICITKNKFLFYTMPVTLKENKSTFCKHDKMFTYILTILGLSQITKSNLFTVAH